MVEHSPRYPTVKGSDPVTENDEVLVSKGVFTQAIMWLQFLANEKEKS